MRDAERRELAGQMRPLLRSGGGEPLPQLPLGGVDVELPARLRVDEPEVADVRQLLLARIPDLDGGDRVPGASRSSGVRQSRGPRKSETITASERWRATRAT